MTSAPDGDTHMHHNGHGNVTGPFPGNLCAVLAQERGKSAQRATGLVPGWVLAKIANFLTDKPYGVLELHVAAGEILTVKRVYLEKRDAGALGRKIP